MIYSCPNQGCRESFLWREQLRRHRQKCTKIVAKFRKIEEWYRFETYGNVYKYITGTDISFIVDMFKL